MLSRHLDREREEAEDRGYPAWAADWHRAYMAEKPKGWTIAERKALYAGILDATRPDWNYGPLVINANEMRNTDAVQPSMTTWQLHVEADAQRTEYGRGNTHK